jgi:predicted amidophosphoribosyltransferase
MKTICPQCGAEIEENWHICWNCQFELPEETEVEKENSYTVIDESEKEEFVLVNKQHIISAGKQLKLIVKLILYSFLVALITYLVYLYNDDNRTFVLGGVFFLAIYIAQLVNLFQAGNDLIKSVGGNKK